MYKKGEIIEGILNINYVSLPNGQSHAQRKAKLKCVNFEKTFFEMTC